MPFNKITYQKSGYFSKLIEDYLDEKSELKILYNRFPKLENYKQQIEEKSVNFNDNFKRQILVADIERQYSKFEVSDATLNNIKLLNLNNTFTITTGHQLSLFTGPLYFLYKIISTINLCIQLKSEYKDYNFVPIYWMATEDHDFEEINHFNFKDKIIKWNKESLGPVGRIAPPINENDLKIFLNELAETKNGQYLKELFEKSYFEHQNLADATRFLVNELFKNEGLVIIDGDSIVLKKMFTPYLKKELLEQASFKNVNESNKHLKEYFVQVNPREINLFYIENNLRERIVFENGIYKINNTKLQFSETEILNELEHHPEKFSPNVILRPLFQEVILPNLCYIGGGGELAYWLELKSNFEKNFVTFPMLLLRNSVLLVTEKQAKKAAKLGLNWSDLFSFQSDLLDKKVREFSKLRIDFSEQKAHLKIQFENLYIIANQTTSSFVGAVKAQEIKQIKGLENLEKRLLKAEKRNYDEKLERIVLLQNELFPNQSLQERKLNFSEFYLNYGMELLSKLMENLKPLDQEFTILVL